MAERILIQPPEIVFVERPLIFLAGPIQGAPDWHSEARTIIHDLRPDVVVASPRKDYSPGEFVYEKQVDWETRYLKLAGQLGVVCFWLAKQVQETPGRAYAQTSRFELGEWKKEHQVSGAKLTVGIEKGFGNERYIRRRLGQDCRDVLIADTIQETCFNAVTILGK